MPYRSRLTLSLSVGASLLLVATAGSAPGCRRASRWATPEFNTKLAQLQAANRCEAAIGLVQAADARDDPNWYAWMVGLKLDCLAKTARRDYGEDALQLVNEGGGRFPKSSRLVLLKGFVYSRLGEGGLARRYYQDALKLALTNIAGDKDGRSSAEDRLVVKNAEANLEAARAPGP